MLFTNDRGVPFRKAEERRRESKPQESIGWLRRKRLDRIFAMWTPSKRQKEGWLGRGLPLNPTLKGHLIPSFFEILGTKVVLSLVLSIRVGSMGKHHRFHDCSLGLVFQMYDLVAAMGVHWM